MVSVAVVSVAVVSVAVVSAGAEVKKAGLPAEIKNATKQLKSAEAAREALIIDNALDKARATITRKKKRNEEQAEAAAAAATPPKRRPKK